MVGSLGTFPFAPKGAKGNVPNFPLKDKNKYDRIKNERKTKAKMGE